MRDALGPVRRAAAVAAGYAVAALVWVVADGRLPGGRWLAVHLFTIGVLTNLVGSLTVHFAGNLLHSPSSLLRRDAHLGVRNAAVVGLLVGYARDARPLFVVAAVALSAEVLWTWWDLRRIRREAPDSRFTFVVRAYQRACGPPPRPW